MRVNDPTKRGDAFVQLCIAFANLVFSRGEFRGTNEYQIRRITGFFARGAGGLVGPVRTPRASAAARRSLEKPPGEAPRSVIRVPW